MAKGSGGTGKGKGGGATSRTPRTSLEVRANRTASKIDNQLGAIQKERDSNVFKLRKAKAKKNTQKVRRVQERQRNLDSRENVLTERKERVTRFRGNNP